MLNKITKFNIYRAYAFFLASYLYSPPQLTLAPRYRYKFLVKVLILNRMLNHVVVNMQLTLHKFLSVDVNFSIGFLDPRRGSAAAVAATLFLGFLAAPWKSNGPVELAPTSTRTYDTVSTSCVSIFCCGGARPLFITKSRGRKARSLSRALYINRANPLEGNGALSLHGEHAKFCGFNRKPPTNHTRRKRRRITSL